MASKSNLLRAFFELITKGAGNVGDVTTHPRGKPLSTQSLKSIDDVTQRGNDVIGRDLSTNLNERAFAALPTDDSKRLAIFYNEEDIRRKAFSTRSQALNATGESDFFSTGPVPNKLKEAIASGEDETVIARLSQSPQQIENINTKNSVTGEIQSPLEPLGEGATVSKQREAGIEEILGFDGAGNAVGNPRAVIGHNLQKAIQSNIEGNRPASAEDVLGYINTANTYQGVANVARSMKGQFPDKSVPNVEFAERTLSGPEMKAVQAKSMANFKADFDLVMADADVKAFLQGKPYIKNQAASMATLMQAYIRLRGLGSLSPSTERIFAEFNAGRPNIGLPQGVVREGATSRIPLRKQDLKRNESTLNDPDLLKALNLQARKQAAAVKDQPQAKDFPTIPEGDPEQFIDKKLIDEALDKEAAFSRKLGGFGRKRRNFDLSKTNVRPRTIPENTQGRPLKAESTVRFEQQYTQQDILEQMDDLYAELTDAERALLREAVLEDHAPIGNIPTRVPSDELTTNPLYQRDVGEDSRLVKDIQEFFDLNKQQKRVQAGEVPSSRLTTFNPDASTRKAPKQRGKAHVQRRLARKQQSSSALFKALKEQKNKVVQRIKAELADEGLAP